MSETPSAGAAARRALSWNLVNLAFGQGVSAVVFLLLAGRLSPTAFGVFALALIGVEVFTVQGKNALVDALVQRAEVSAEVLSTAFWGAMAVTAAAVAVAFVLAAPAARWVATPVFAHVLPALALTALAMPAIAVMEALVVRELKFRALSLRSIAGVTVGGVAGLAVAFSPQPEWALVAQRLGQVASSVVFLQLQTRWRPTLDFRGAFARPMAAAWSQLWLSQLMAEGGSRLGDLVLGGTLGPAALGVLRVADRFMDMVHGAVTSAVMSLWVPILSRMADDPPALAATFRRLIGLAAAVCTPAAVGLALVGPELAQTFLAPAFASAGRLLVYIGIAGLFIPFAFMRGAVLSALRRNGLGVTFSLADCVIVPTIALVFGRHGLPTYLVAGNAYFALVSVVSLIVLARVVGIRVLDYLAAVAPAYLGLAAMAAAVIAASPFLTDLAAPLRLAAKVGLGAGVYGLWLTVIQRRWSMEMVRFLTARA